MEVCMRDIHKKKRNALDMFWYETLRNYQLVLLLQTSKFEISWARNQTSPMNDVMTWFVLPSIAFWDLPLRTKNIVTIWRIIVALWEHIYRKKLDGFCVKETTGERHSNATAGPCYRPSLLRITSPLCLISHNVIYST
jgi:hypothetical protein